MSSVPTIAIWHPKGPGLGYVVINLSDYDSHKHHRADVLDPRVVPVEQHVSPVAETPTETRCNALGATTDESDDADSTASIDESQKAEETVEPAETSAQKRARQRAAKKLRDSDAAKQATENEWQ